MKQKSSAAQRAASSRYRERNKLELQRKARERMAKRRAKLKKSEEAWCAYTAKAREHAVRYRASHAAELALDQVAYRARHSIARVGFNAWHDAYLKRHPRGPPPEDEELGDWPESSDSEHSASPDKRAASPISDECARPPTPPPESAPYDDHLNYFLDYLDPTMAPDYVPKPGQRPFFQRGNQRYANPNQERVALAIEKSGHRERESEVAVGGGKKAPGEHLDVIEGELGLIRGEDGAVHVVAGGAGGGHAVRVVASEVWVGLRPRSLEGFPVNVAVRPRVLGFGWVLCECERVAAGYGSLSVNRGGVLADKRGRCLHFGAVKAIESRDDEGERVLAISRRLADVGGRSPFWVVPSPSRDATNTDLLFSVDDIASSTAVSLKPRLLPQNPKMLPKTRCAPRYFPQPGHEDTIAHDGRKDGRYFVVGAGHCGNGVFTDAKVADKQTDGFSGYEKHSAKRWTGVGGVEELWATFCDRLHRDGCHTGHLPDGWDAPVPVVRGCAAPTPAPAPAALNPGERLVALPLVFPAPATSAATPAPHTPRPTTKSGGSGNSWASPLVVRSSVSPSPLRPAPHHQMAHATSNSPRTRAPLNADGSAATSAGSSLLSAMSSSSSSASARTPTSKKTVHSRVQSSPNAAYDTDFYYDSDSDDEPQPSQARRLWAVRGLDQLFPDADSVFDALRQNMDRLKYMEVRTSTSAASLRRFAAS
ncbi:hypothetical protein C8F04DRAFT_1195187 [Mycena alexandri]|uniref:Uncharacterized protein n=1 Tax=Mycena alexandri TaxID=1745969 RepID=A0AAD6S7N1_9AGAR|nr:hypothetical protein C8F04DRAFT_1195187 [Mycena alexandri]